MEEGDIGRSRGGQSLLGEPAPCSGPLRGEASSSKNEEPDTAVGGME